MWEFLKKIFTDQNSELTVVTLEGQKPDATHTYRIKKTNTILLFGVFFLMSMLVAAILFFITPLGNIFEKRFDQTFRKEVLDISRRVEALQDSLRARDMQLNDIKNFVRTLPDTTFEVDEQALITNNLSENQALLPARQVQAFEAFNRFEILNVAGKEEDIFPALMPAEGHISQGFSEETGHHGIDIALIDGTPFSAIAEGVVIFADWTINYGYILLLQHRGGIVTVYKHAEKLLKQQGDYVVKGDILGTVGNRGVISTGSHLHFEIWENGIPKNPLFYLNE